jgi:hypothetical protein
MTDRKISALAALTTPAAGDYLPIIDISEPLDADKNKRITVEELLRGAPSGTAAAPSIAFEGDADTGIYRPGVNQLGFSTNGVEQARIDSSGRLLVGTSSFNQTNTYSTGQRINVAGSSGEGIQVQGYSADQFAPAIDFSKSRAASIGTDTIVQDGDALGNLIFNGYDGAAYKQAASIFAIVDGTPGADDMPGRLVFSVTADGASSPTEAARINNAGELLVGYTADNGAYKLQVNSQIFATSATVATSDGRYKENVATLGGCLDLVKALRPVSFTWKPQEDITCDEKLVREGHNFPDGTQVGFIAQEVQEALAAKPWLGSIIKENTRPAINDNAGNELAPEEQFLGIAEGNLIAVLTNALQEAIAKIETLEAKVATLEAP